MRLFKAADPRLIGIGEGTFHVAEELIFQKVGRDAATVYRDHRSVVPVATGMNRMGHALLPGTGLARDQYGCVFGRDQFQLLDDIFDRRSASQDEIRRQQVRWCLKQLRLPGGGAGAG